MATPPVAPIVAFSVAVYRRLLRAYPSGFRRAYGPQMVHMIVHVLIPGTLGNLSFLSTSLLIVVGVVIDTMRQLEAQLMIRNYQGFMK